MEELPAYLIVTIAITIFMLLVVRGMVSYGGSYDGLEMQRELEAVGTSLMVHPRLVDGAGSPAGAFSEARILTLADSEPAAALADLGLTEGEGVRIIDVSEHRSAGFVTCQEVQTFEPPPDCVLLDTAEPRSGDHQRRGWPVTVQDAGGLVHAARLEVTIWR